MTSHVRVPLPVRTRWDKLDRFIMDDVGLTVYPSSNSVDGCEDIDCALAVILIVWQMMEVGSHPHHCSLTDYWCSIGVVAHLLKRVYTTTIK